MKVKLKVYGLCYLYVIGASGVNAIKSDCISVVDFIEHCKDSSAEQALFYPLQSLLQHVLHWLFVAKTITCLKSDFL